MFINYINIFLIISSFNVLKYNTEENNIKFFKNYIKNEENKYIFKKKEKSFKINETKSYKNEFNDKYLSRLNKFNNENKFFVRYKKEQLKKINGKKRIGKNFFYSFTQSRLSIKNTDMNLYSSLQILIDQYCYPSVARCLGGKNKCKCVNISDLNMNIYSNSCLNNCGSPSNCHGYSNKGHKIIPKEFIINKKILTCVISNIQRRLNNICGRNKVFRFHEQKGYCIPYDLLDSDKSGYYCINEHKKSELCWGYFRDTSKNIDDYHINNNVYFYSIMQDPCNEDIYGNGELYIGCQDMSISKRKCLNWSSLNIPELLDTNLIHNYCRNPENLDTIYCFVKNKGFVVREYCEPKQTTISNDIIYSEKSLSDFDITMKNVSDFRIKFMKNECNSPISDPDDPNRSIIYDKMNYTYHEIDGEIALTITFKGFQHKYNSLSNNNLSICACHRDYYFDINVSCSPSYFRKKIGTFIYSNPLFNQNSNVFYINKNKNFTLNVYGVNFKNEAYIFSGNYSYECSSLIVMYNFKDGLNKILNIDINKKIQKIYPPLDSSKTISFIYGYSNKALKLETLINKNNSYILTMDNISYISPQRLTNLKNGNNLICIKYNIDGYIGFYYAGKIIYDDRNSSDIKYLLKNEDSYYDNFMYTKRFYNNYDNHYFSFSDDICEKHDNNTLNEKELHVSEVDKISRIKNYSILYPYSYVKNYFKNNSRYFMFFPEYQNELLYILMKNIQIKSPINYLCERDNEFKNSSAISLVHYSDFLFTSFSEFAHYFEVYNAPTNIHNSYIKDELYNFISNFFYLKDLLNIFHKTKILSLWAHENDNYVSLWFISTKVLTPFFLIKYQISSPRFAFADYIINSKSLISFDFYIFSIKNLNIKKYNTYDFYNLSLIIDKKYPKLLEVVSIEIFSHNKTPYFLLLLKNNDLIILDRDLVEVHIIKEKEKYLNLKPIKVQCLDTVDIMCFIIYRLHQILWFSLHFNLLNISFSSLSSGVMQNKLYINYINGSYNDDSDLSFIKTSNSSTLNTPKYEHNKSEYMQNSSLFSNNKKYIKTIYMKHIYLYIEYDKEVLVETPNNITVINKLEEYIIYVSFKESNKLHIYATDRIEKTIEYYKSIKNEDLSKYRINYTFSYFFRDKNFINFFVSKEGKNDAICSFVHENSSRTEVIYKPREWYIYNKNIELKPIIKGDKRQIQYFSIRYNNVLKGQNISINKKKGIIQIQFNKIKMMKIKLHILMYGLFHIYETYVTFNIVCDGGKYYKDNECHPCERGYYNNLKEIRKNISYYKECIPCQKNKTTSIEIATSKSECLCDLGYEYIKDPNNRNNYICSPCPKGKYKNTISNELCQGNGCKENSTSFVIGAKSILEITCLCNAGYYLSYDNSGSESCQKCLPDYYCPGILLGIQKCPPYNKTIPDSTGNPVSMDSCFCKKGYEPINMNRKKKKGSRDWHYYKFFFNKYNYKQDQINPQHICMECDIGYYKDTISFERCKKCPKNSTNRTYGSTSIKKCNSCYSGYYKNLNKGCSKCLPNHFCVGSFPKNDLVQYTGDAVVCPNNSITIEPYENNASFKNCLCIKGYVKNSQESYNLNEHCKPVPLNFYKDTVSNDLGKPCPLNSITLKVGAKSINECICNKGYYYNETINGCEECPIGYYCQEKNMKTKFMKPKKCPNNSGNTKKGLHEIRNCQCHFGYAPNIHINKLLNDQSFEDNEKSLLSFSNNFVNKLNEKNIKNLKNLIVSKNNSNGNKKKNENPFYSNKLLLCIKCPPSTYKAVISNEPCDPCIKNSNTSQVFNNSDAFFCLCNPGYYLDQQTCKPCSFSNFYCAGEKIYIITEDIYNEIINIIKKNISTFSDTNKNAFVNSIIYKYDKKNSDLNIKYVLKERNPFNFYSSSKIPSIIQKYNDSIDISSRKDLEFLNEKKNNDNLKNILKKFFHRDHENVIYAKYEKFVKCQTNTIIPLGVDSSHNFDDCKCAKGYYLESKDFSKSIKICKPCKEGTFKNYVGDEKFCVSCPPKSTSLEGSIYPTHCFCKEGFFYSNENCLECLEGATCKGGLYENTMKRIQLNIENILITKEDHVKPESKKGYFLDESVISFVDVSEWKFIKCPINGSCLGKNKCHYTMNNYFCVECTKGYTNSFMRSLCVKCPNNTVNIILLFIIYVTFCFIIIIISYLNISSGFYRRSIHSIVIKIAVNYISCMLVITVLKENNFLLPSFVLDFYKKINNLMNRGEKRKIVSVDCLLRHYFNLSYSDSFFYTSLIFFLIPILLIISLTIILFIILKIYRLIKKKVIANRLDLLKVAKKEKIFFLANSLEKSYSKERFIMILRYIKLDHHTFMDRILIFFEDMIPVYVTFLFIIHAKTSLRMFQLFDCSYIKYSNNSGKYILSRASSVQCNLNTEYFKFFILGLSGTIVWSLGIPLFSFFVLYINRHNLFHENIRIKYGFLHNGYLHNRWYWEVIVFIRKISVLFITTVIIFPKDETNASRLLLITFVAVFSLCVHFIFQPFDKRNFFTLNKLENFSLYIWVFTIIIISVLLSVNLKELLNFIILFFLVILHVIFSVKLLFCLFYECVENIRRKKTCYNVPIIGSYAKLLGDIVEKKKKLEPLIYYDKISKRIAIILPECVIKKKKKIKNFAKSFRDIFKGLSHFYKKKKGYKQLKNHLDEVQEENQEIPKNPNIKKEIDIKNKYMAKNGNVSDDQYYDNDLLFEDSIENQRIQFCSFLKSTNVSIYGNINKECRMFAIEIYKELFGIFLKNVTLTYVSDMFFEFIFKISINIGNLIDNLDQKEKIFESLNEEQNYDHIIQWSLERKEKYNENKKLEESKLIFYKNMKSNYKIPKDTSDVFQFTLSFCDEMGLDDSNDYLNKEEKKKTKKKIYISKKEKEKLFSFFSDDLLNKKIALSEFYFILIELKLKYFSNLPSCFYMFRIYKKLEKKYERKKLRKLDEKLKKCLNINDDEVKIDGENLKLNEIKEKIPLLYKEFKDLSNRIEQLKYECISLNKKDSEKDSSEDVITDLEDNISLSSQDTLESNMLI
ncbi:cysteine repeat modular protein 1, putative [Plasmodium gallinaceum]|uniref:Cysteine repeat modular protein 1, putative n=1 Tax=Plasmodium gallinaceum TaxID=5849 RepID=A0A1J1GWG7_PLAGA|nr:cysteine repeat modular protein 1, putative [Plasmodium gallinaceum]CRG96661.1 cysteine repeat modular protein 1, putative [Plasmodium gallinaceum]